MVEAVWIQRYMQNNLCSQELLSLARDGRNTHYDLHLIQWHRWTNMRWEGLPEEGILRLDLKG